MSNAAPCRCSASRPHPLDLQPPDHVGQRLARATRCSGRSRRRPAGAHRRVRDHVVDRLLPAPAERVHAGVDDQPAGAHRVGRQHPDPVERRGVEPHLVGEPLGVEPPALGVRRDGARLRNSGTSSSSAAIASWRWWPGMPSWKAVVLDLEAAPARGVGDVHEEHPAAGAVLGAAGSSRRSRRSVVGLHVAVGPAAARLEPVAHRRPGPGHRDLGVPRPARRRCEWCSWGRRASPRRSTAGRRCRRPRGRARGTRRRAWRPGARPISWISWAVLSVVVK